MNAKCLNGDKGAFFTFDPNGFAQDFGFCDDSWIQGCLSPCNFQRQFSVIDDAAVSAVAAQIMVGSHENTIDRTGVDTQSTEHAFGVVDDKAVDSKALANGALLFFDVDAVHRASLGAFVATDARGQVESMEAPIPGFDSDCRFRIRVGIGERLPIRTVRLDHLLQGDGHPLNHSEHGHSHIAKPHSHDSDFS